MAEVLLCPRRRGNTIQLTQDGVYRNLTHFELLSPRQDAEPIDQSRELFRRHV